MLLLQNRLMAVLLMVLGLLACRTAPTLPAPTAVPTLTLIPTATPTVRPDRAPADITGIAVDLSTGSVVAVANVLLPDTCTDIVQIEQERRGSTVSIEIMTGWDEMRPCDRQPAIKLERIELEMQAADTGFYIVEINGVSSSFVFDQEALANLLTQGGDASIHGQVWHDLCAFRPGIDQEASGNCISFNNDQFRADGQLTDEEPGIGQVIVALQQGTCPGPTLLTTETDLDGRYQFDNLLPGDYCISITGDNRRNVALLRPGQWTQPVSSDINNAQTVEGVAGEIALANFGWDYHQLPRAAAAECANKAFYLSDGGFFDGIQVRPGQSLEKSWRIQNIGTCRWSADYQLVQTSLDGQTELSRAPISQTADAGDTIELTISLVAPQVSGGYRYDWWLESADGQRFGVGLAETGPLFAQFVVVLPTPVPTPIPPEEVPTSAVEDDGDGSTESNE